MFQILLLLFILVPIVEIAVLLQVGSLIGGLNTLLLIIVTAVVGATLVKQQGMQNWMTMQAKLAQGQMPGLEMAGGLLIFLAGVFLITPGFVTDLVGLAFLLPPTRHAIARTMMKRMIVRSGSASSTQFHFRQRTTHSGSRPGNAANDDEGTVIDGEYSEQRGPGKQINNQPDTTVGTKDDERKN